MKRFVVTYTAVVEIAISDDILALHKDAEWVQNVYGLDAPEKIAEHLAYNVGLHYRDVDELDGFADRAKEDVTSTPPSWNTESIEAAA